MQRKNQRTLPLFCVLALQGLFIVGCGSGQPTATGQEGRQFQDVVLRVACPNERTATVISTYAPAWATRQGARVEVVRYDPETGPLATNADVYVVGPALLPNLACHAAMLPIPESTRNAASYAWARLLPLYRDKLLVWEREAYALPLLGEAPLCFYRADLFDMAASQTSFEKQCGRPLRAPDTWEEFADVAAFFHRRKEAGLAGPSLPPLPAGDDDLDRVFYSVAAPFVRRASHEGEAQRAGETELFSFHFDLATGKPRLSAPGFVHTLTLLQRLQQYRPSEIVAEPAEAFASGQAVLCLADATWIDRFQKRPAVRGKFGVCPVPGSGVVYSSAKGEPQPVPGGNRLPYLGAGGWLGMVPRSAPHSEAAFALLAELSGPEMSRQIVIEPRWGGGAFRRDHFEHPAGWNSFGLEAARTNALVDSLRQTLEHRSLRNPVLRLRHPDERDYQRALLAELRPALTRGGDPRQALAAASEKWEELTARRDFKKWQADYYLSLSLQPPR